MGDLLPEPGEREALQHWITLHEVGNVTGLIPLLVMDVWEHAFLLDHAPAERSQYIDAFFANISWAAVERRLTDGHRAAGRG